MSASTIPTFLTTFLGLVQPLVPNTVFGPPTVNEETAGLHLLADENGASPVTFTQTWRGQGSQSRNEEYAIPCLLFDWTGDNDQTSAVALFGSAMSIWETVAGLFRPDASLGIGGKTLRAEITAGNCLLLPRRKGLLARIDFTITVQAGI